jgi:hypothetical protein
MKYYSGQTPKVGDRITGSNHEDMQTEEIVVAVNDDGTIDIEISGHGVFNNVDPSNSILLNNKWGTFWEVAAKSKEGDILECEDYYGNIVNNGDYAFLWEDSWAVVKLSGEFLGMRWRIKRMNR